MMLPRLLPPARLQGLWRNRVMSLAATVTMVLMLVLLAGLMLVLRAGGWS